MNTSTVVGLDVHKRTINVALLSPGETKSVEWQIVNEAAAIRRLVRRLLKQADGNEVRFCYEAGPCGYALQRQLEGVSKAVSCAVIAPSLIPRKPGERIKTDRRDARKLASLHRAGLLTEVCAPTPQDEAVRDLVRAREDARQDLMRARHRLVKYLLRRGFVYTSGKKAWSLVYRQWLRGLRFEHPCERSVFDDYFLAIQQIEERLKTLDGRLHELAQRPPYAEAVGWLRCFRGIDTLTAISILAELYDFRRFGAARELMAYLGLVPSEHSSGGRVGKGSITKTGNSHVRRLLIEAAWHYRHRPGLAALAKRRTGQPAAVIAIADRAQHRLHRRFQRMTARAMPTPKVVVALARELSGFVWAAINHAA